MYNFLALLADHGYNIYNPVLNSMCVAINSVQAAYQTLLADIGESQNEPEVRDRVLPFITPDVWESIHLAIDEAEDYQSMLEVSYLIYGLTHRFYIARDIARMNPEFVMDWTKMSATDLEYYRLPF